MFEGLRARWAELRGKRTRYPPPQLLGAETPDPALTAALRTRIERWRAADADRYARLFLFGRPHAVAREDRALFDSLAAAGLVKHLSGRIHVPCVRLFPLFGKLVATDLLSHTEPDQVFSLMFEQVYLVRTMDVRPDDRVLEVCVGSGVNSLFAADTARSVVGVDLSERALAFARFNRGLNDADGRIDLRQGSLFEPVGAELFDLVLINPPFELVPKDERWFLHSDGGEDGLDVVRAFVADLPAHLTPEGRLGIITWSPGSARGPALLPLLRDALPGHHLRVDVLTDDPLEEHVEQFRGSSDYAGFRSRLDERGLDRVFFLYVLATGGREPGVEVFTPEQGIAACHAVSDAWV